MTSFASNLENVFQIIFSMNEVHPENDDVIGDDQQLGSRSSRDFFKDNESEYNVRAHL